MTKKINLTAKQMGLMGLLAVMIAMVPVPSQGQTVKKRLGILEKQLKAVQRKVFARGSKFPQATAEQVGRQQSTQSSPSGSAQLADMEARISQIETQLRQLTGRVEESNFQFSNLKQQMDTMARDYEFRLGELEKRALNNVGLPGVSQVNPLFPQSSPTPEVTKPEAAALLPEGTPEKQYSYAQKLVTKGQYAQAEIALKEFLKLHPEVKLAGNAQYWLGQTYYVRKMYTKATRAFLEGYNTYPESIKAPAFLLKIGMSLNAMGEKVDACDAFKELASRYPNSLENKNKRPAEEKRAGCR